MNRDNNDKEKESGFFDLDVNVCKHPGHEPSMFIHIPQGKSYRHVCPKCKNEIILTPPQIIW